MQRKGPILLHGWQFGFALKKKKQEREYYSTYIGLLQHDLSSLEWWETIWQMHFNPSTCTKIWISPKRKPVLPISYSFHGQENGPAAKKWQDRKSKGLSRKTREEIGKGTQVQFQTLATKNSIQQPKSDIDKLTSQVMLRLDKLVGRCFDAEKEIGSLKSNIPLWQKKMLR